MENISRQYEHSTTRRKAINRSAHHSIADSFVFLPGFFSARGGCETQLIKSSFNTCL